MIAAHINKNNIEQSVQEHCRETAAYAASEAQSTGLFNTMFLTGLLHDIGKNTELFNTYIHNAQQGKNPEKKINHSSAGAKYIIEKISTENTYELFTKQLIAYAIISHHGLNDCLSYDGEDKFTARLFPAEKDYEKNYKESLENSKDFLNNENIKKLFDSSCSEIKSIIEKINSITAKMNTPKPIQEKCFLNGCLARIILSMLMDADRRNTAEFMNGEKEYRMNNSERTIYFSECLDKLNDLLVSFAKKTDKNNIDQLRQEMSDQCFEFAEHNENGIYKLPIPTGGGKTFSAIRFALRLAQKEKKDRIIYTAPFLSILEQNAAELKAIFGDTENILEHHSNVIINESSSDDILHKYELLSDNWNSPVILTTMVRFLDVLFGKSTMDIRRMHQLKNSVIIIDEAQAIPVSYIHMFNTMMNFLSYVCGTTIVLCTATQPIFEKAERPLLYSKNACMISDIDKYTHAFKRADIITEYWDHIYDTQKLADLIISMSNNNTLIILNTKSAVQKLYNYMKTVLPDEYRIVQLTTYMCPQHRLDVIRKLKICIIK